MPPLPSLLVSPPPIASPAEPPLAAPSRPAAADEAASDVTSTGPAEPRFAQPIAAGNPISETDTIVEMIRRDGRRKVWSRTAAGDDFDLASSFTPKKGHFF
jgi:hypothetical protein